MTGFADEIAAFRGKLKPDDLATVDALRLIIQSADDRLEEEIKWNAPSFKLGAEHRVTLGLERSGGARVVLHRGVSKKDTSDFTFNDVSNLATWPAKDRGVIKLASLQDVVEKQHRLTLLIKEWLKVAA